MFFKKKKKSEEDSLETIKPTKEAAEAASAIEETTGEDIVMDENNNTEETTEATTEATATENMVVPAEELALLNRYREAGEDCIKELGNMEIRKARVIASYGQLEQASQQKLVKIGQDLGIPEGSGWSVNPDGTVVVQSSPDTESEG